MYYDSAEEWGRLAGLKRFFFHFERGSAQNRVCSPNSFLATIMLIIGFFFHSDLYKIKPL